jgi:PAS domain S-box-containing protein
MGMVKQTKAESDRKRLFSLLSFAMENLNEGVTITDLNDEFVFVNKSFCRIYGYTPDEIIGERPTILIPPGAISRVFPLVTGSTRRGGWKGELINVRKDGTLFPIQLSTAPIRDDGGQLVGLVGLMEDISHRYNDEELKRKLHFSK